MERRLTTILAADVVGYSRLMAADEAGTLTQLKVLRNELIESQVAQYGGRLVKLMGDGTLMEFASVVDAVRFAVDLQGAMAERNAGVPEDRRLIYRIGVNLGDVIIEGDDLYGDGVNIAARLEGLAEPGGVCVSGTVFDHVKGKVELDFSDLGEHRVKNIPESLRVYSVVLNTKEYTPRENGDSLSPTIGPGKAPAPEELDSTGIGVDLTLPDNPSIAVLPFANMSADPEQEFFSDGIAEDIITALSKIPILLVVARNSTFTYKGQAVDVKQVSREQGVRYVLEGGVRKVGNRVRVTAQLIDATTGHHIWAERYDRDLVDIFAVQDEITREIVVALDVRLREGEQARIWSGGTKNVEAWECVRLGMEALNQITPEGRAEAPRLIKRALDLDQNYPMAWVLLGQHYFHDADIGTGYNTEKEREGLLRSSDECAQKALELDPSCADAYALLALCHLSKRDYGEAIAMSEKAVALAPNQAENLAIAAAVLGKSGQPQKSFELVKRAMRLCPIYPGWYLYVLATACRLLGRNESAIGAFKAAIKRNADNLALHVGLASTLGELGRLEDAETPVAEILRLSPDFSVKTYMEGLSYRDPAELARFEEGLCKAGLPE
jgi:TolB-like protein/class 3 adenylate cyclase